MMVGINKRNVENENKDDEHDDEFERNMYLDLILFTLIFISSVH